MHIVIIAPCVLPHRLCTLSPGISLGRGSTQAAKGRAERLQKELQHQEELDAMRMQWVKRAMKVVLKIEDTKNELSGEVAANSMDELEVRAC